MSDTYVKFRNEVMAGGASDAPSGEEPTVGGARAAVGLSVIAALLVALGMASPWALVFVIGLLICIFLHEVGHFVTAKWTGMKVTQFFLFMGPKLWSFRRGETEYGLRAYPVGAFVRIIGMNNLDDVDEGDEPRSYRSKSYPRRLLVITAGSIMHMLIAVALLFGVYAVNGQRAETGRVVLVDVLDGGGAMAAGLQPGDVLTGVDGVAVVGYAQAIGVVRQHAPGEQVTLDVLRGGQPLSFDVTLIANPNPGPDAGKPFLGIRGGDEVGWNQGSVADAARHSITDLGSAMYESVGGLFKVLNPVNIWDHLSGDDVDQSTQPSSVVGISRFSSVIGEESGFGGVLLMLAGVNVFVGLFNMIPLLPFDGGHAAIATYERLRSRRGRQPYRADVAKMIPVTMAVMVLLLFLVVTAVYLDFAKPIR